MDSPLLATKFHLPVERGLTSGQLPLLKRDRLLSQLDQGLNHKLLLISAPAGFGKTTLLANWAHQTQLPVSWLSLDQRDNDPMRFWSYLVVALQQACHDIGESTLAMLRSSEPVPFESFLIPLLNELAQQEAIALVLDDYQMITTELIHTAMVFFLEHLPTQVQVAITTRTEPPFPLARWRSRAQLTELQAADLRFTDAEATQFLRPIPFPLTQTQVEILQTRTEGWVAGLQLALIALRITPDPTAFIQSFHGSQRYILDYLVEEVLERQPEPVRSFLLQTSILEQMCGSLCDAVVPEVNGSEMLEHLERQNLFVVPLDNNYTWYRYHHLFAEALRHQLDQKAAQQFRAGHNLASQWFEQHGYITDAIGHAIAAQAYDQAATFIEQEVQTAANPRLDAIALRSAFAALPVEMVNTRPWLLLALAWTQFTSSQFEAAMGTVQALEQLLKSDKSPSDSTAHTEHLWGIVLAMQGMQARQQGDMPQSVALMEQALGLLRQDYAWLRSIILLNLGVTYFVADNYEVAKPLLPEVSRMGRVQGMADPAIAGLYLQSQFLALRGQIEPAIVLAQAGLDLAIERHWLDTYAGVLVQVALADLLREQNQLELAAQNLSRSIDRAIANQQPGLMMGYITLARVRQAQGDFAAAWVALNNAKQCQPWIALNNAKQCQPWMWPTILCVEAVQVRLQLAAGNVDAALTQVKNWGLRVDDALQYNSTEDRPMGSELNYLTLARVLIASGRSHLPHWEAAMQLLTRLHEFAKLGGRTIRAMETLLLQALAWHSCRDLARSLDCLNQAFNIPCQGNYIRLFVDEGQPMTEVLSNAAVKKLHSHNVNLLLAAFGSRNNPFTSMQPLVEPLSQRELEVLQYLAQGLPNQAIADHLFVSLAAVKWHARNIYGKLAVNNRTQAVAKARELGVLKF
jgi:LuxR family transcriptional regulator, maltose regulon positive regulatory protein